MPLTAEVNLVQDRPMLVLNGEPTAEFWCFGDPNAIGDFVAARVRICQFDTPFPSWWVGDGRYNFAALDAKVKAYLAKVPFVLLMPRVCFGLEGEGWWAREHPDEISAGRDLLGEPVPLRAISAVPVECPFSAGSELWGRHAAAALSAFVTHCEQSWPDNIVGYQIGGGISAEWFRWWTFIDDAYEDYSPAAVRYFRKFLRQRYGDDAALRQAWQRQDATISEAEVPHPQQLQQPRLGFFREPSTERPVIDWLDCLSAGNASQLMQLASAAKSACGGRKLVGAFFGYFWPHWNTQNPARSGHLHLRRLLDCPDIDFISSPYHYENRSISGFHHAQTVPQSIERAGKLHLAEIDTATHLAGPGHRNTPVIAQRAKNRAESLALLRRDVASVLGTAGTGWWMDLWAERWYADAQIQASVATYQHLARELAGHPAPSHAEVALVIDDESCAFCSLRSPLNRFFTALPRQCLWSDLGFPLDTLLLSEVPHVRPYRVYVFLNAWHVGPDRRPALMRHVRQSGITAIWFYGAGFVGGPPDGAGVSELVGIQVRALPTPVQPEIELLPGWCRRFGCGQPGEAIRYGAHPDSDVMPWLMQHSDWHREVEVSPHFIVEDPQAIVLGRYVATGAAGLALTEQDGWCSMYSAAPLLPGTVLRSVAARAGVHMYSTIGCSVRHRGPLVSVTATVPGRREVTAPGGNGLVHLQADTSRDQWQRQGNAGPSFAFVATVGQTEFFWCSE